MWKPQSCFGLASQEEEEEEEEETLDSF